jgi:chemotaxis methyl-accepting protein methylase
MAQEQEKPMKTIAEIKNQVAQELGFQDWKDLYWHASNSQLSEAIDQAMSAYATAATESFRDALVQQLCPNI